MVAGTERHKPGVVGWCGDRDGAGAAHVGVAELVSQQLQFVGRETVVIPQDVIVRGTACALWERNAIV